MELLNANELIVTLGGFLYVFSAIGIFLIVCQWKVYSKAGKPGWASLIPIYNIVVLLEIVRKPIWWLVLMLIIINMAITTFTTGISINTSHQIGFRTISSKTTIL